MLFNLHLRLRSDLARIFLRFYHSLSLRARVVLIPASPPGWEQKMHFSDRHLYIVLFGDDTFFFLLKI